MTLRSRTSWVLREKLVRYLVCRWGRGGGGRLKGW